MAGIGFAMEWNWNVFVGVMGDEATLELGRGEEGAELGLSDWSSSSNSIPSDPITFPRWFELEGNEFDKRSGGTECDDEELEGRFEESEGDPC